MTTRRLRATLLLAAAVPLAAAAAAAVLKASHLALHADRHRVEITARPRPRFCLFGQRRVQMRMPARWSAAW
ncbi:hypothetical protein ACH4TC_34860 [Streptomyces spororaveus]|uniref:hypothetical protein n=1 Tax=Streptomyces spororaveus TaxID=284039 RepID=UPI003792B0A0